MFEGDILEHHHTKGHDLVKETIDGWKLKSLENLNSTLSLRYCKWHSIIGNKYENPELLGIYNEEGKENIKAKIICYEMILEDLKKKIGE